MTACDFYLLAGCVGICVLVRKIWILEFQLGYYKQKALNRGAEASEFVDNITLRQVIRS